MDPQISAADTPLRDSTVPLGAPRHPDAAQDSQPPQRPAGARTADPPTPVQLALPPELLAAMTLPAPIPSARRRGRPIRSTPDISNYQPEVTR
jgi:hypothetical protein